MFSCDGYVFRKVIVKCLGPFGNTMQNELERVNDDFVFNLRDENKK